MSTPDPLAGTHKVAGASAEVSKKSFVISGIVVDVYGLDEIHADAKEVSCLWLLNPRLSNKERMKPIAAAAIRKWNSQDATKISCTGLIAVAFDQRNHGTRLVDKVANEAWRGGNPRHAQDMFSIYQGTAADTSMLLTYLPGYIFPQDERTISSNIVMGVSLGGHASWHVILHDERFKSAIVVIGCADYIKLMTDRAAKSKLASWTSSSPPGAKFLGSTDFPSALVSAVDRYDPAGLLMTEMFDRTARETTRQPDEREMRRLTPLMRQHLAKKRIFNLAGGADRLVPYTASEPFLNWLKAAVSPTSGWYRDHGIYLQDKVYDGVGHELTAPMLEDALSFIVESVQASRSGATSRI